MAWSDLTGIQMVSYTDAQTSGFSLKPGQSQTTSNQCMTKSDIATKYNADAPGYPNNRLPPKNAWVATKSVVFSVPPSINASGTVTILGPAASFRAELVVLLYSGGTFKCTININGIIQSVSATSTGTFNSDSFSLSQGTYNFSISTTSGLNPSGYGASIQYTQ